MCLRLQLVVPHLNAAGWCLLGLCQELEPAEGQLPLRAEGAVDSARNALVKPGRSFPRIPRILDPQTPHFGPPNPLYPARELLSPRFVHVFVNIPPDDPCAMLSGCFLRTADSITATRLIPLGTCQAAVRPVLVSRQCLQRPVPLGHELPRQPGESASDLRRTAPGRLAGFLPHALRRRHRPEHGWVRERLPRLQLLEYTVSAAHARRRQQVASWNEYSSARALAASADMHGAAERRDGV